MTTSARTVVKLLRSGLLLAALAGSNLALLRPAAADPGNPGTVGRRGSALVQVRRGLEDSPPRTSALPNLFAPIFSGRPGCDSLLSVEVNQTLTFSVQAFDQDTGSVTLYATHLPPGATMSPSLPVGGNPVSSTFSWTPTTAGEDSAVFVASDGFHNVWCWFRIRVTPARRPPLDCARAAASVSELWPPNHQFVPVHIVGLADSSVDSVRVFITGVTQDEPTNTLGDGNTCPDARFSGGTVELRAERTGTNDVPGNGRVYAISFIAGTLRGEFCQGRVFVCVPHDQGQGHQCIDDGQRYDATVCRPDSIPPDSTRGPGRKPKHSAAVTLEAPRQAGNSAAIEYSLREGGNVNVAVYDVLGRQVAALGNSYQSAGTHQVTWNAADFKAGMYFVRVRTAGTVLNRTLLILK